jgi:hypothetical protein
MRLFDNLPKGRWLVKSIDRFHLRSASSNAAFVDVVLQKLPENGRVSLEKISPSEVSELLARPKLDSDALITRELNAGFLSAIRIGCVLTDGYITAKLRDETSEILLSPSVKVVPSKFGDAAIKPTGWGEKFSFYVLNAREYWTATSMSASRCLLFQIGGVEYILPRMVIFQAFYALNSMMIHAICVHPWTEDGAAGKLISFRDFPSGLETRDDRANNTWKVVLALGMSLDDAPYVAPLWFDDFARAATANMFLDANAQGQGVRGAIGRSWYANASLPFDLSTRDVALTVRGFPLRRWPGSTTNRFLITSILSAPCIRSDVQIAHELFNSGASSPNGSQPVDKPYAPPHLPSVVGSLDAIAIHQPDANINAPENVFEYAALVLTDLPPIAKQVKESSKSYLQPTISVNAGPSATVSAGNSGNVADAAARANVIAESCYISDQFSLLLTAMETLLQEKVIDSFEVIGPPIESSLKADRNSKSCWCLLSARHKDSIKKRPLPKRVWEVIPVEGSIRTRCAFTISIKMLGQEIVLLEIEERPTDGGFRYVVFQSTNALDETNMRPVLDAIRSHKGRFGAETLVTAFTSVCNGKIKSFKHWFDDVEKKHKGETIVITELSTRSLANNLNYVAGM